MKQLKPWGSKLGSFALASLLLGVLSGKALSFDLIPDGISISGGKYLQDKANITKARVAVRWDWEKDFISSSNWTLDGYFDLGYSQWQSRLSANDEPSPTGADKAWQIGFSPVFRLSPQTHYAFAPFLDVGVGLSYQSEKNIEKKLKSPINMGGHTQFEIRTLVGARFGENKNYELSYGWFHYSNAHLHSQNEGLDFQVLGLTLKW